jgi:hypothetical protein
MVPGSILAREHEIYVEKGEELGGGSQFVHFDSNCLSVKADEIALKDLFSAIAKHTGITIASYVPLNHSVSVDIDCYPIPEAIEYILRDYSFVYADTSSPRLWILPQDGDEYVVLDSDAWSRSSEPDESDEPVMLQIASEDPEEREDALVDLGERDLDGAVEHLAAAIADPEQGVREGAVVALSERGGPEAIDVLAIAIADQDPRIREEAIDALGEIGGDEAVSLLKQALGDQEPFVRHAAAEELERLLE